MLDYQPLWLQIKPSKPILFLNNKSRTNSIEIITAVSILGNATATDIANFVLKQNSPSKHYVPTPRELQSYRSHIKNRLRDRPKINSIQQHPSLITQGFLTQIGFTKNNNQQSIYALTFKGSFLTLGFNLSNSQLKLFIKNSTQTSLFFTYLNSLIQNTSLNFVKIIFINPIKNLIQKGLIPLNDDFMLSLSTIVDYCGYSFFKFIEKHYNSNSDEIETLYNFSKFDDIDWRKETIESYYPEESKRKLFLDFEDNLDSKLLFKIRISITQVYDEQIQ